MKSRTSRILALFAVALMMLSAVVWAQFRADAAPSHQPEQSAVAAINQGGHVDHRVLIPQGNYTMANTTPVSGSAICIDGDPNRFAAQLTLTGTMAGTAPTLAVVLQHSIDGGTTWITLNTFTTINATVTPANQYVQWADVPASTAIVFGDCYRYQYTFGGSAGVAVNIAMAMLAK
jgi:hypothetical protein